jgi:hypothetical protein
MRPILRVTPNGPVKLQGLTRAAGTGASDRATVVRQRESPNQPW